MDEPEQDFLLTVHLQKCCCLVSRNYTIRATDRTAMHKVQRMDPILHSYLQTIQEAVDTHATQ